MREDASPPAQLGVSADEARHVAKLLRYAVSLNTTVGLVRPERRLASTTYRAAEVAALVLVGRPFEQAAEEAAAIWTGSLEEDHRHALALLQEQRAALTQAMSDRLTPEQLAEYLEVAHDQFLELLRPTFAPQPEAENPEG